MTLTRRTVLASAALAAPYIAPVAHAREARGNPWRIMNSRTAPDPISREILAHRVTPSPRLLASFVDADSGLPFFPQLIEQSWAQRDEAGVAKLMDSLTEAELSDLAQLYVNATTEAGRPEKLMFVMAQRLDEQRLSRVSRHFGFERTHHAVHAISPGKMRGFLRRADPAEYGPVPGVPAFGPNGRFGTGSRAPGPKVKMDFRQGANGWRMVKTLNFTKFLNMTPTQIYTAMRSAEYGSLSPVGAAMEFVSVMSGSLGVAYYGGQWFGTHIVVPVLDFYMPGAIEGLGDWIGPIIDTMHNAWTFGTREELTESQSGACAKFMPDDDFLRAISGSPGGGDFGALLGLKGIFGGACGVSCYYFDPL